MTSITRVVVSILLMAMATQYYILLFKITENPPPKTSQGQNKPPFKYTSSPGRGAPPFPPNPRNSAPISIRINTHSEPIKPLSQLTGVQQFDSRLQSYY